MNTEVLKKVIGERISELRNNNKYSKKEVREKTYISEQMQKQYENATVKKLPSIEVLLKLSELYHVPINYFLSDTYNTPVKSDKHPFNSVFEVAKTIVDLSLSDRVGLYIDKNMEETHSESEDFLPDYNRSYTDFAIRITSNPTVYEEIREYRYDDDSIFLAYESSILYLFLDKIYNYLKLYHEGNLDADDYKSLCEKALKAVKEQEKEKQL